MASVVVLYRVVVDLYTGREQLQRTNRKTHTTRKIHETAVTTQIRKWGCVLLLDEADIFLQKRDRADLRRNSLVSVFLRVLEYYSGILFLTTNRVGMFDEAFKSRIHISLYYPPLDRKAYLAMWDMNLTRTQEGKKNIQVDRAEIRGYAKKHYKELKWNGR